MHTFTLRTGFLHVHLHHFHLARKNTETSIKHLKFEKQPDVQKLSIVSIQSTTHEEQRCKLAYRPCKAKRNIPNYCTHTSALWETVKMLAGTLEFPLVSLTPYTTHSYGVPQSDVRDLDSNRRCL